MSEEKEVSRTEIQPQGHLSRRSFIGGAAMVSSAFALMGIAGCSNGPSTPSSSDPGPTGDQATSGATSGSKTPWEATPKPIAESEIVETVDCEIVVAGGGITGLVGAAYAAEQGASVHVLEKGGTWGMHRLCTAGFNSDLQKKLGLTTDRKEFVTSTWAISNGVQGRMSSYGKWFDNSGPYINWLEGVFNAKGYTLIPAASLEYKITNDGIGMSGISELWQAYSQMIFFADAEGKFFATGVDVDWTGVLAEHATENGALIHYNSPAVQLVRDDSGRVTGVIAENDAGEYVKYNASKGVLLATGDMAGNKEMMEYFNPSLRNIARSVAESKDTGDGQVMGMWIGADMDDFAAGDLWPFVALGPDGVRPDSKEIKSYAAVASLPTLMVDTTGRRLAAENLPFQAYSIPKLTATPNGFAWSIWDSAWLSKFPADGYMVADYVAVNTEEQLAKDLEAGITFKFDTIDELSDFCGFDKDVFKASFDRYQALCAQGEDVDFYKDKAWMAPIDTPPFYASMHGVSITSTRGGLKNDERCRVLDKDGLPIPGLYVCGNTSGSFYGNVYPPNVMGSGIGHGQCFAWISIKDMLGIEYI